MQARSGMRTVFVVVKVLEENKQLILVPPENTLDLWRLLRVRHEYLYAPPISPGRSRNARAAHLEHMKRLELDVLALIAQEVHHHLQIGVVSDVSGHDGKVGAVEQDLAEELEGLAFGDVVVGQDERSVRVEELRTDVSRSEVSVRGIHAPGRSSCPSTPQPSAYAS